MPLGKNGRETIVAALLPRNCPHSVGNFEREKNPLFRRENPGAFLGTSKETKTSFRPLLDPRFEWLEVA